MSTNPGWFERCYHPRVEHVQVLGLILALSLGLISLALVARLPQRDARDGVAWLPITLLLYNLWVIGFLTTGYLEDHVFPQAASRMARSLVEGARLAVATLAVAWLHAHIAQLYAFLGMVPTSRARRAARSTRVVLGVLLVLGWVGSSWSGDGVLFLHLVSGVSVAVFPAALAATLYFFVRLRHLEDIAWRRRLSTLALAYAFLFACLFALAMFWGPLSVISRGLPTALDALLELLYNVVAVVWVMRLNIWLKETSAAQSPPLGAPALHRGQLLAQYGITKREGEIIELICLGKTNQEIADQLFISLTTVKDHNYVTFQKLGVRNRTELTRLVLNAARTPPK
jgi:DNA-binding CsgD family transcriptional regulator